MSSRKEQTREKILDSAQRLLLERGYHGVGLGKVARDAGISRQAVYLHFKSKADLLVALAQHIDEMVGVQEILRPAREAKTVLEAIDAGVAASALIASRIYDIASIVYAVRRSDPAAEAAWQDRMASRRGNVKQFIERLQREGSLSDEWTVEEATDFVWALLSIHSYEYLVIERSWTIDQFVSHLRRVLHRTMVKEPDTHA